MQWSTVALVGRVVDIDLVGLGLQYQRSCPRRTAVAHRGAYHVGVGTVQSDGKLEPFLVAVIKVAGKTTRS